jgi:leucyl-tRNA synthetase
VKYDFRKIEEKWRGLVSDGRISNFDIRTEKKCYVLEMLPYPSGKIHMGHVRNYMVGDVIARFKKMKGFDVIHPMGWDSFGLPAENAAIESGMSPSVWTDRNIADMKKQLKRLSFSYDWDREISTCSIDYYFQEQKIFLDMFSAGLIYRK